jgi:hypothetical protein
VAGKEASQSFLLVGTVKEPKVGDLASLASLGLAKVEGRRSVGNTWNGTVMNQWEISRILKWRYVTVPYEAIFWGDIEWKWPLNEIS